jgi:long-chain acyl-CoA synthetase
MKEISRIFDLLELYGDEYRSKRDALCCKESGKWKSFSSSDYIDLANLISQGLLAMGVARGTRIATVMLNSPEWNFFDMGIMQAGAIQVPIYPTISEDDYRYILNDAGAEYIIVSNGEIARRIQPILHEVPAVKQLFTIKRVRGMKNWREILEKGRTAGSFSLLRQVKDAIGADDLATIIYTSGTTGRPKGVMLTHRNFISNFTACALIPDFSMHDRALSFLPLCHVYERMLNYMFQYFGMSVFYVESLDKVAESIREVRPHAFASVPRMLEKIYNKMVIRGRNFKGLKRATFFWALRQGHKFELGHTQGRWYDIKLTVAKLLVLRHWKKALGGRIKFIVSGSAPLHPRLARVFWAAGIPVMEGYGLTETSPVIAVSNFEPGGLRFGTVGPVLPGVEVRIADDGEILCRGPNVMMGYYNRPEKTAEVIDRDGWFHTGDIGLLVDGKYLKITDRKKEMFKTSTGKYIAPQVIEQRLKESPFIEQVMVVGENRKYTAALIVPNFEHLKSWCAVKNITFTSPEKAVRQPSVVRRFGQEVRKFNQELGQTEKIKKFRLVPHEWSVESGELSPTLKLKRNFIQEKYYMVIEETYRTTEFNYRAEE